VLDKTVTNYNIAEATTINKCLSVMSTIDIIVNIDFLAIYLFFKRLLFSLSLY